MIKARLLLVLCIGFTGSLAAWADWDPGAVDPKLAKALGAKEVEALIEATRENNVKRVKKLLKNGNLDVNGVYDDDTALTAAAERGLKRIVKLLLGHPNIDPNKAAEDGRTPLHLATAPGIDYFENALSEAQATGSVRQLYHAIKYLYALLNGYHAVVELLLQHEKTNINAVDEYGRTPLIDAFSPPIVIKKASAKKLLEADGIDVNAVADVIRGLYEETDDKAMRRGTALVAAIATHHYAMALPLYRGHEEQKRTWRRPILWALGEAQVNRMLSNIKKLLSHPDLDINKGLINGDREHADTDAASLSLGVLNFSRSLEAHIAKDFDWSTPESIERLKHEAKKLRNLLAQHGAKEPCADLLQG